MLFFFFKQKTAYEIGLGIPAEPLFRSQKELTKMQLDNQKEIAETQNETQKEIAGIQSATSRQNTKDQDRKSVVKGKRVNLVGCRTIKKKNKKKKDKRKTSI